MQGQRKIYLINPKFQLTFSLWVTALVLIPSVLYPIGIYQIYEKALLLSPGPEITQKLQGEEGPIIIFLCVWHLLFSAIVFIGCIYYGHRIAGPMYKLQTFLKKIQKGESAGHLFFRKGDQFPEIAEEFNKTMDKINKSNCHVSSEFLKTIKKFKVQLESSKELTVPLRNEMIKSCQNIIDQVNT